MSQELIDILLELNKAVKTLGFYPPGHPNLDASLHGGYTVLRNAVAKHGDIKYRVEKKNIYAGETMLSQTNAAVAAITKQFVLKKVRAMVFTPGVSFDEFKLLIDILKTDHEEVLAKGGVEGFFAKHGVRGILLNEMSYAQLDELKEKMEETAEEEKDADELEEVSAEEALEEVAPEEALEAEDGLNTLIKKLENEKDSIIYTDLAVRIMEQANVFMAEKKYDEAFPAARAFFKHSLPHYALNEELREKSVERYKHFLNDDFIRYLINRYVDKDDPNRALMQHMLFDSGDQGITLIIETLIATQNAFARRTIFNILIKFGERARPKVEALINDERWFVVRQMVSLLGALGGESSIKHLNEAYKHKDARVKKEVLKALSTLSNPKSEEILLSALKENDLSLKGQAIISLGMIKSEKAVPQLCDIASKSSEEFEMRKEAIKALGMIKSKDSISSLSKITGKSSWFGKETHEELKILAVSSLHQIGGKEAMDAVTETYKNSSGRLYNTCKRFLEGGIKE